MVTPEIGWLQGKKEQLIDSDWKNICKMSKKERFEMQDGHLIVFENDSVFKDFGTLKRIAPSSTSANLAPKSIVISENGKYGVQCGEQIVLPLKYNWLSKINDQEFLTRVDTENHLYDDKLKRIGNRPFDRLLFTRRGNYVFFYNDQTYVVSMNGENTKIIP